MAIHFDSIISKIISAQEHMRPSEAKLARLVLSNPVGAVELTMDEIARKAGVSAPTVARFCAAVGCSGFREFKIRLAQDRSYGLPFVHPDVTETDAPEDIAGKIFARTQTELIAVRRGIDIDGLSRSVDILANAKRIEFYGSGNSGIVAQDLQHRFFRLGIPTVAYNDPHVFCMSALTLQKGDAVVLVSNSGRNRDILEAAKDARSVGAQIVALTRSRAPLAELADAVVTADVLENSDIYSPMTSRIAHLVIGDILQVSVAQRKGEDIHLRLERAKKAVARRRLIRVKDAKLKS